jgi:hypothetical protein
MAVTFNPFTGNLDFIDTTAAAGSDTEIQFNDGGKLAGDADLSWDTSGTTKVLGVGGDINLDDGGANTLTLQTVTPTAARTISFPDATGTVGLVAGSSGQLVFNDAGAYAGVSTATVSSGNITLTGRFISSLNGAASAPPGTFTGTWFTGGTATTTKPQVLIEPTGTTSTAWSTSGTGLGVNAPSGFAGRLLDLQVNGTSAFDVTSTETRLSRLRVGPDSGKGIISYATNTLVFSPLGAGSDTLIVGGSSWTSNVWTDGNSFLIGSNGNESGNSNRNGSPIRIQAKGGSGNGSAAFIELYTGLNTTSGTVAHTSLLAVRTFCPAADQPGLQIGGTTSSFPAIKRDSVTLKVRLADDSADAPLTCAELTVSGNLTISTKDIVTDTTTGTKIGTATTQKLGFFGVTPVVQQTELTDELTTITHTAPGTPDYAIQNLSLTGYGFVTEDEGNTVLSVIANLQARVNELETKLVALGFLADAD